MRHLLTLWRRWHCAQIERAVAQAVETVKKRLEKQMSDLANRINADTAAQAATNKIFSDALASIESSFSGLAKQVADLKTQIANGAAPQDALDALTALEAGLTQNAALAAQAQTDAAANAPAPVTPAAPANPAAAASA